MKFCRYGALGCERPGIVRDDNMIADISSVCDDITGTSLDLIQGRVNEGGLDSFPVVDRRERIGVPLSGVQKIIAIGLNYADHAAESNLPIPDEPIFFTKAVSSLNGPNDDIILPRGSKQTDWEVELGVVIGKPARYIDKTDALSHVFGYTVVHDVSERYDQLQRGTQWVKGKSHDTFSPVGPWIVTADEIPDPGSLDLYLDVNGTRKQSGSTSTMIFKIDHIISYVSQFMTLMPGDIILTGTPPGVGMGMKPDPEFLKDGDVVTLGISGLGEQRQTVRGQLGAPIY